MFHNGVPGLRLSLHQILLFALRQHVFTVQRLHLERQLNGCHARFVRAYSRQSPDRANWFRDSSAQNHFGPGLLGPDVSAHFSIRDCSAHFSGTARPIFLFIYFIYFFFEGGGQFLVLFCLCASKTRVKKLYLT